MNPKLFANRSETASETARQNNEFPGCAPPISKEEAIVLSNQLVFILVFIEMLLCACEVHNV